MWELVNCSLIGNIVRGTSRLSRPFAGHAWLAGRWCSADFWTIATIKAFLGRSHAGRTPRPRLPDLPLPGSGALQEHGPD